MEKRKKKSDADGGGWAEPANKAKIVGGKRKNEDVGKFGTMSEVLVLHNMLENMPDLQAEIADGLGQEIGEECGEKVRADSQPQRRVKRTAIPEFLVAIDPILTFYTVWPRRTPVY